MPLPSTFVKIQIMGGKGVKAKHSLCLQKFVDNVQQCFAFTPQENFPVHNLNFPEGEGNWIETKLPLKSFLL